MSKEEKIMLLPNPNAERELIVADCLSALVYEDKKDPKKNIHRLDCDKIFTHPDGKQVCIAYINPANLFSKGGCGLASNKINIETEKKRIRIGQQKQKRW